MRKMMKRYRLWVMLLVAGLMGACSEELFEQSSTGQQNAGIQFGISTVEMADELVGIGGTRSGGVGADSYVAHTLDGGNAWGLNVQRQPLPLVGIHSKAVHAGRVKPGDATAEQTTRASIDDIATTANFHDSLTIWGYSYTSSPSHTTTLYDQILVKKISNWRTSVQWPYDTGDNYMKFYALSPSMESTDVTLNNEPAYNTPPVFTYKLPETAGEMVDLLYGESSTISIKTGPTGSTAGNPEDENRGLDNKIVDLQFRHILTAIRFSQGVIPTGLTITKRELEGIPTSASYNPTVIDEATGTNGVWSTHTGSASYSINTNFPGTAGSGVYIDNNQVFFVLPQTVQSGVKLNITLTDSNTDASKTHTLSCSLAGDVWKKGYTVNYLITIGEVEQGYYFTAEVTGTEVEHSNSIVSSSFTLHSYRNYMDYSTGTGVDSRHVVNWSVSGYSTTGEDDSFVADKPVDLNWLRSVDGISTGTAGIYLGGDGATVNFSLNPQEYVKEANHSDVLGANTLASDLDLSTHDPNGTSLGATETANCYIVNRMGSYTFPLVYGNKTTGTAGTPVAEADCFKDHTGTTISYKLIKDQIEAKNSGFVRTAVDGGYKLEQYVWDVAALASDGGKYMEGELVWQDVASLIKTITLTSSEMGFEIGVSKPGNAVLALKARKKITYYTASEGDEIATTLGTGGYDVGPWETLWTWHIWMTDEVYKNTGGSYDSQYLNYDGTDHIVTLYQTDGTTEVAKVLPVNLGWVPDEMGFGFYEKHDGWVELKQQGSNKTIKVKITQHARQPLVTGTGTFYQWGRPTAFPAVRNVAGTARTIYDIENNDISSLFELQAATGPGDAISQPYYVLQGTRGESATGPQDSWFDVSSADYSSAMWYTESKTVYDPSPRGFRVPAAAVFYGLSQTNTTIESGAGKLNMYPEVGDQKNGERSKGGYFYVKKYTSATNPGRYDQMVYMPATGQFHGNKTVGNKLNAATNSQLDNANGIYWTSDYVREATPTRQGCGLWITPEQSFSEGTAEKPVLGFFNTEGHKMNYYGTLKAIRPRQ